GSICSAAVSAVVVSALAMRREIEPVILFLGGNAHARESLEQLDQRGGAERGPAGGGDDAEKLRFDLARGGHALGIADAAQRCHRENPGEQRSDHAADAVNREDVERIIDLETLLDEARRKKAHRAAA